MYGKRSMPPPTPLSITGPWPWAADAVFEERGPSCAVTSRRCITSNHPPQRRDPRIFPCKFVLKRAAITRTIQSNQLAFAGTWIRWTMRRTTSLRLSSHQVPPRDRGSRGVKGQARAAEPSSGDRREGADVATQKRSAFAWTAVRVSADAWRIGAGTWTATTQLLEKRPALSRYSAAPSR